MLPACQMGGGVASWGGTLGGPSWSGELEQRLTGRSFVGGAGVLPFETVGVFMLKGRLLAIWSSCKARLRRSVEWGGFGEVASSAQAGEGAIMQRELGLQTAYN